MAKIHTCKMHRLAGDPHPYTTCDQCGCEYCDRYWLTCPRCYERRHGYAAFRANLVAPVGDDEGVSRRGISNRPAIASREQDRIADRIDGYDRDDLGESPDY